MATPDELGPEIEALATALGLIRAGSLDPGFFADPLARLRTIVSDSGQRAGLLNALDDVLPPGESPTTTADGDTITRHPIARSGIGSLSIAITRSGPFDSPTAVVGLYGVALHQASGVRVEVDFPLVRGSGSNLEVVAGSPDHPLAVAVDVPVAWLRPDHAIGLDAVRLSAVVLAPPQLADSRVVLTLAGLDLGVGPAADLVLDPAHLGAELAHALTMLLIAGLQQVGAGVDEAVQRLITHLPAVLGLDGVLPALPLGDLVRDPVAFVRWLALLTRSTAGTGPALVHWVDAVAQLLGADPTNLPVLPTAAAPQVVTLVDGGAGEAVLELRAWLETPASSSAAELHLGLDVHVSGSAALVAGRAELVVIPLGGSDPVRPLPSAELVVESTAPLLPGATGLLTVGVGRGGLRWNGTQVVPVLELDGVHVELPGVVETPMDFPRLDLTHARTLAAEAKGAVGTFLTDNLGGSAVADAVLALLGLSVPPTAEQLGAFANDPLGSIGAFHRQALQAGTYLPVAQSILALFGVTTLPTGAGTVADPWLAPLPGVPVPAASDLEVSIAVWDAPLGGDHELHLGLAVLVPAAADRPTWSAGLSVDLVTFTLPAAGPVRAGLLGETRLTLALQPPALTGAVRADALELALQWRPGAPVGVDLAVRGLVVNVAGTDLTVGTLQLPQGLTPELIDAAWPAVRLLLARAASSGGGPVAAAVGDLLGLSALSPALPDGWPLLELPTSGHLADLLADPVRLLRDRLAALLTAAADASGQLPVASTLDLVRDLLTHALPVRPELPRLSSAPEVSGAGSYDDPWRIPLTDATTPLVSQPIEAIAWVEPGPPRSWAASAASLLGADLPDLVGGLSGLSGVVDGVAEALAGLGGDGAAAWLTAAAEALDGTDGLTVSDVTDALPTGVVGPTLVTANHHRAPQAADAVAATRAQLAAHAAGRPVLLLAPTFAPADVWSGLLAGVDPAQQILVDLGVPGVTPSLVDLGAVTAGTHYLVDLADDGTPTLDELKTRLHRVVQRVQELNGGGKVAIVGHSVAGLVAVAYAATNATRVATCVAIATPFVPGASALFAGAAEAAGLRLVRSLVPAGLGGVPALDAALDDLGPVLDGYAGVTHRPFPVAAFTRTLPATTDLSHVPTLAVAAQLEAPLVAAVTAALTAALAPLPDTAPTHLAWGVRTVLDLGTDTDAGPTVEAHVRLDLGRVALTSGAADPAHPTRRLVVDALVARPDGWLVGSPGAGLPIDVRLRAARLRFEHSSQGASFAGTLYDGSVQGSGLPVLGLDDARAARLLDALVTTLAAEAPTGSSVAGLLDLLQSLELATVDLGAHTAAVRADAIAALKVDPGGWLATRTAALLEANPALLGLAPVATAAGAARRWRRDLGDLPLELTIGSAPWTVGVHTTGAGLELGAGASITLGAQVDLSGTGSVEAGVTVAGITLGYAAGALVIEAPPALPRLQLFPLGSGLLGSGLGVAAAPSIAAALLDALSSAGLAAAATAVLEDALGGLLPLGSLVGLLREPSRWLSDVRHFGSSVGGLDPVAVNRLLTSMAEAFGVPMDSDGVALADGLHLAATGADGGLRLALTAAGLVLATDGPTLDAVLAVVVAPAASGWSARPEGTAALTVDIGTATWPTLTILTGLDEHGFSLAVRPGTDAAITLLPHFAGLWDLLGGGVKALLPGVLDGLVSRLSPITPGSVLDRTLAVADGLGLRPTGGFDSTALATLEERVVAGTLVPAPASVVAVLQALLPTGAPVVVGATGTVVQLEVTTLPVAGTVTLTADFAGGGTTPTLAVALAGLVLGPVTVDVQLRDTGGVLGFTADLQVDVPTDLGFDFTPALRISAAPLTIAVLPLGSTSPLTLQLAPKPGIAPSPAAIGDLVVGWVAPIVAGIALEFVHDLIDRPLWTPPAPATAITAHDLLRATALVSDTGSVHVVHPLPDPSDILRGLLSGLGLLRIPVTPELSVGVYAEGSTWLGVGAVGTVELHPGDFTVSLLLGSPQIAAWVSPPPGLGLLLLDDSAGLTVRPALRLGGVGVRVARNSGPLVDTSVQRIGAVSALVQAALDLTGGTLVQSMHGGVEIEQIGLPIGQSGGTSNAVAASLLKSSDSPGDDRPASPPTDLTVISDDSGALTVLLNAKAAEQPFYVDIHKTFGPLHIDRIGLQHLLLGAAGDGLGALVDGGVSIAGLTVDVQGLEITVPLKHAAELSQWGIDLSGLAVAFSAGPVSIAGGLIKQTPTAGVEYDGMLKVSVGSFGLTALGSYAKSGGTDDPYTSLFVFVVVKAPIGGPPFLFVTGLAGGAGYNRQLIVPSDPTLVAKFPLVRVMQDGVPSDPMQTLHTMSAAMPPRRGSYWVAAGVTFTTFELINSVALAYVALDRGFEVGLMGLMTMALPDADDAIVSIELALLARYSSRDQLLAVRAQLTNNSWLISRDCQLTGGFAFYNWFGDAPQTLLTIGGMGPNWRVAPGDTHPYPVVPPVGFHWSVGGGIVVKGETYFALTPRQLAFGGRLEATYDVGPIRVWFAVWLDVDIEWIPLHYHVDAGISIGAAFHFTIDLLFTSITINISISLGGSIVIDGPPLHGSVTVELEIASVTVDFGRNVLPPSMTWAEFAAKFAALTAPPSPDLDAVGGLTSVATVAYGQFADATKGAAKSAPTADGSKAHPWPVRPEFGLAVASKLPVTRTDFGGRSTPAGADPRPGDLQPGPFSIKPMGSSGGGYSAHLVVSIAAETTGGWVPVDPAPILLSPAYGHFPIAAWLVANTAPPGAHPDMWTTVSGASLAFPVSITEASGALGAASDIPISTLVEESAVVKPLPFGTAQVLAPRLAVAPPAAERAAAQAAPTAARPARLVTALSRGSAPVASSHRLGTDAHISLRAVTSAALETPTSLRVGETHVWAPPQAAAGRTAQFRGRGEGTVRVTTLSPTGFVLDDRQGRAADVRFDLHPEGERVVVTGLPTAAPQLRPALTEAGGGVVLAGWQSGTLLTQVAKDTLLGPGCALLLPYGVTAPRPALVERHVPARRVLSAVPGVNTLLPAETEVVLVLLDALVDIPEDLEVTLGLGATDGGALGSPLAVRAGTRRCLAYPVIRPPEAGQLAVHVVSAAAWRMAGVIGVTGALDDWAGLLRITPHPSLVVEPTASVEPPIAYQLATDQEVPA